MSSLRPQPVISEESSSSSSGTPKSDEGQEFKFQLSQEIYDMLLRNISPQLDDNENVVIEFENVEVRKEKEDIKPEILKESLNYTAITIINPKKNPKKANLIYLEDTKNKSSDSNLGCSLYFEQIRDISIAQIWIKSRSLLFY